MGKKIQISFKTTQDIFQRRQSDVMYYLYALHCPLFTRQLGACIRCISWLLGVIESLCSSPLNEAVSWGQRSWLRGEVKAFMSSIKRSSPRMKFKWVFATDGSAPFSHVSLGDVSSTQTTLWLIRRDKNMLILFLLKIQILLTHKKEKEMGMQSSSIELERPTSLVSYTLVLKYSRKTHIKDLYRKVKS